MKVKKKKKILLSFESASSQECGGNRMKDTPVPMPNTVVKLQRAKSSWGIAPCEDRASPRDDKRHDLDGHDAFFV